MSGFIRFTDGDWSWNTGAALAVFDLLADRSPDEARRAEVAELRDENVIMLDLRDPRYAADVKLIWRIATRRQSVALHRTRRLATRGLRGR